MAHITSILRVVLTFGFLTGGTLLADQKWIPAGEFKAGGDGKLAAYNGPVSACRIVCTEGSIIVNTFIVIEGAKKSPISVGVRIPAGSSHTIPLPGAPRNVTGFRISDNARGRYRLEVLKPGGKGKEKRAEEASGKEEKKEAKSDLFNDLLEAFSSDDGEKAASPAPAQPAPPPSAQAPVKPSPPPPPPPPPPPSGGGSGGDKLPWE